MYHVTVDELTNENSDDQYQVLVLYTKIECKNHNWINEDGGKKVENYSLVALSLLLLETFSSSEYMDCHSRTLIAAKLSCSYRSKEGID